MSSVLPTLDSRGLDLATLSIARISLCHEGGGDVATVGIPLMAWVRWQLFGGDVTIEQSQATISCFDTSSSPPRASLHFSVYLGLFRNGTENIRKHTEVWGGDIYRILCTIFGFCVK